MDNITHDKTESVHFLGLMNSATKLRRKYMLYEQVDTWTLRDGCSVRGLFRVFFLGFRGL